MPQITIEYSHGVEWGVDIQALAKSLHEAATGSGVFPVGAVRTMARPCVASFVGDGGQNNAFINISVRIGPGRPLELRQKLTKMFFDATEAHTKSLFEKRPAGLQIEVSEHDPAVTLSRNTMIPAK